MHEGRLVSFTLGGLAFEYDEQKNQINIKKHGISFKSAARVFFDYDRIELCDDEHSEDEIRYDTMYKLKPEVPVNWGLPAFCVTNAILVQSRL